MATEKYPRDGNDDVRAQFSELVRLGWENNAPSLWEKIDTGVRHLLERAKQLEARFNEAGNLEDEALQDELSAINHEWDKLNYTDLPFGVTGRLRPMAEVEHEEVMPLIIAGIGIHNEQQDLYGSYYPATGYQCQILGFGVERINNSFEGVASFKVDVELSIDDDPADDPSFMLYVEDIEYIDVPEPTHEGAEAILWENFPELMQYICDTLPDDCGDDMQIIEVLDNFAATFNIDAHSTTLTREQVKEYIELYITDRLSFDDGMEYTIEVDGRVYGEDAKKRAVPRMMNGTTPCRVGYVRLVEQAGTEDTDKVKTYLALVEVFVPLPARNGGWVKILVPTESIKDFWSDRPEVADWTLDELDTEAPVFNDEQLKPDLEFEPSPSVETAIGATAVTAAQIETETPAETRDQRLERYTSLRTHFVEMHTKMLEITARRFETAEEATAAQRELDVFLAEFNKAYPAGENLITLLSGEAVVMADTKVDIKSKEDGAIIELNGQSPVSGDLMTHKRAQYVGSVSTIASRDDEYMACAFINFIDIVPPEGVDVLSPAGDQPLFRITTSRRLSVDMSVADLEINYLELDQAERRRDALDEISRMKIDESRKAQLLAHIGTFADGLEQVDPTKLIEFEAVEDLNNLAMMVMGNAEQSEAVASALSHMLGSNYLAFLTGPSKDNLGNIDELDGAATRIVSVVSRHPNLSAPEPALLVEIHGEPDENGMTELSEVRLVPLSTVEGIIH